MNAPTILAHQGGWDEFVLPLLPVLIIVLLLGTKHWGPRRGVRLDDESRERRPPLPPAARRRRRIAVAVLAVMLVVDVAALGWFGLGARALAVARNLIFPGLGLIDQNVALGLAFMVIALLALAGWTSWGIDWPVPLVWAASVVAALVAVDAPQPTALAATTLMQPVRAGHEFAIVMLVVAGLARARLFIAGLPGVRRLGRRVPPPDALGLNGLHRLRPVDRAQAAGILAIAERLGPPVGERELVVATLQDRAMRRRARAVGVVARARLGGDPYRRDNAGARAALSLWGALSAAQCDELRADARRQWAGVPASEPCWIRPLDGTLVAIALSELGEHDSVRRWIATYRSALRPHSGRRVASLYTVLAVAGPSAPRWEQAAASALARVQGWIGDEDWDDLRRPALGAAARGGQDRYDERLIAAGRVWARLVDDEQALKILQRPTVARDAMAVALDRVADAVAQTGVPCAAREEVGSGRTSDQRGENTAVSRGASQTRP